MSELLTEETLFDDISNPLDGVEDVLSAQNWTFERTNRDELFVNVKGRHCMYKMMFAWDEEYGALQFCCEYDLQLHDINIDLAYRTLGRINRSLWLGHFDIAEGSSIPSFRHTQLFRGMTQTSGADHLSDLIQIAIDECDKNYPTMVMLSQDNANDNDDFSLALMTVAGQS